MAERVRTTSEIDVWGTILFVDVASTKVGIDQLNAGLLDVIDFVRMIDRDFSTYKPDSEVSRIRRGELKIEDASNEMREVWSLCEVARNLTDGSFDP